MAVSSRAFVFLSCILRYDRVTYRQIRPALTMSLPLCFINSSFYNQPGKWACKNEFKDLQCRIMFPQCSDNSDLGTNKAPCKKTCVDFSSRCPGADVSCDALSDDPNSCYDYDYAATTGNVAFRTSLSPRVWAKSRPCRNACSLGSFPPVAGVWRRQRARGWMRRESTRAADRARLHLKKMYQRSFKINFAPPGLFTNA